MTQHTVEIEMSRHECIVACGDVRCETQETRDKRLRPAFWIFDEATVYVEVFSHLKFRSRVAGVLLWAGGKAMSGHAAPS